MAQIFSSTIFDLQLDLPFSIPFYRWLLYEDSSLGLSDLSAVAPEVQTTLKRLQNIVRERDEVLNNSSLEQETKNLKVRLNTELNKRHFFTNDPIFSFHRSIRFITMAAQLLIWD